MKLKSNSNIAILCLLGSAIFGYNTALAESQAQIPLVAQKPDLSRAVLTPQDLPPGFTEPSPTELASMRNSFSGNEIEPNSLFQLTNTVDISQFQIIIGGTFIATPEGVAIVELPLNAQKLLEGISGGVEDGVGQYQGINLGRQQLQELTNLGKIGEFSAGATRVMKMSGLPVRTELVVFKQGKVLAWVIVGYLEGGKPLIPLADIARKLDSRILQLAR
jgi:hypothetical protein